MTPKSAALARRSPAGVGLLGEARALLEQASSVGEVKGVRDKAEALRAYARTAGEGLELQNQCAELKLRAERKAGELLGAVITKGGDPKSHDVTLEQLGVSRVQSSRWQLVASMPEGDFEAHISDAWRSQREITSSAVLKLAKELARRTGPARPTRPAQDRRAPDAQWRIFCRDARDLYGDEGGADLAVFSPPYNVGVDYDEHDDGLPHGEWCDLLAVVGKVLAEGWGVGRICVNTPMGLGRKPYMPLLPAVLGAFSGFEPEAVIVWDKGTTGNRTSWGSWRNPGCPSVRDRTELVVVFRTGNAIEVPDAAFDVDGDGRKVSPWLSSEQFTTYTQDLWTIPPARRDLGHPAPFPVELPERLIRLYGWPGCTVVDPFAGSGSTGVAALHLGADVALVDVSERYCDLMYDRLGAEAAAGIKRAG